MMGLHSPGTGLERVGLKRNTSIIEKMTNLTYATSERDDDDKLINYLAASHQEQDISPDTSMGCHPGAEKTNSPTKRKRAGKNHRRSNKVTPGNMMNTSSSAHDVSCESSPTLDINSKLSSSQRSSELTPARLIVDRSRTV